VRLRLEVASLRGVASVTLHRFPTGGRAGRTEDESLRATHRLGASNQLIALAGGARPSGRLECATKSNPRPKGLLQLASRRSGIMLPAGQITSEARIERELDLEKAAIASSSTLTTQQRAPCAATQRRRPGLPNAAARSLFSLGAATDCALIVRRSGRVEPPICRLRQ
jgi:hypothetical protein